MKMCDFHNTKLEKGMLLDFKCLKFHLKVIRKTITTGSVPLKQVNKSMKRSVNLGMLCVFSGKIIRCCANLFQGFPFLLHQSVSYSSFQKLNTGSILKLKVASPKPDAILVAINKRINTNSNEDSGHRHVNHPPIDHLYKCHENTNYSRVPQLSKAPFHTSKLKYVPNRLQA